jgi:thioredoxin-like negative regulator of GroEL
VTSLALATILQASIIATGAESYAEARRDIADTGRPMVILVGADWCPACVTMKNDVVPAVKQRGLLKKVAYAVVNLDRQKELAQQLVADGPIPQFIMYRKTRDGWMRKKLIGGQNVETIEAFINEGVAMDDKAKASSTEKAH